MKPNPLRRISVRLTLWNCATTLLLVGLLGALLYVQLARSLSLDLDQELRETAQNGLTLVELEHGGLVWEGTEPGRVTPDPLPRVEQRRDLVRLVDRSGRILSSPSVLRGLPVELGALAGPGFPERLSTVRLGGEWVRVYTAPVLKNGRMLGALQVVSSLTPLHRILSHVAGLLWAGGLVALTLSLALGQFLARRAMQPVQAITRAACAVSAVSLSERLRLPDTGDELSYLASSFDAMLDRVEAAYRRQREFAADASHELRTPLALIQGEASLACRSAGGETALRAALAAIETEAGRMARLVDDLLLLARLDRGELLRSHPVGLDELAHEVTGRMGSVARGRGVRLSAEADASVTIRGDETALRRVLMNLIENALQHTSQGEVSLRVFSEGGRAVAEVLDTGCGISPAHQQRIFERFYRVDAARGRGGAGLGLSLCREVIQAHRGEIRLTSEPGRGTTVTLRLPLLASGGEDRLEAEGPFVRQAPAPPEA